MLASLQFCGDNEFSTSAYNIFWRNVFSVIIDVPSVFSTTMVAVVIGRRSFLFGMVKFQQNSSRSRIHQNHPLSQWLNRFLHVPIYTHWSHHCYTTLSCFNPGRPTSLWWAQNVSHVRESLRDAFEETFGRKQTRYDHKSLWKPFTQPALRVQQFKHHNMRSAVLPSMSLANLLTNPFWGYHLDIWLGWSAIVRHKKNYSKNMLDLFATIPQILWDSMFLMIFSYRLRLLYIMALFFNSFQLCPRTKTGYHTFLDLSWSV